MYIKLILRLHFLTLSKVKDFPSQQCVRLVLFFTDLFLRTVYCLRVQFHLFGTEVLFGIRECIDKMHLLAVPDFCHFARVLRHIKVVS